jgi:hypothetical protein
VLQALAEGAQVVALVRSPARLEAALAAECELHASAPVYRARAAEPRAGRAQDAHGGALHVGRRRDSAKDLPRFRSLRYLVLVVSQGTMPE